MKSKILIVDDAELNRELLKEILKEDYEILEADNGEIALKVIEEEHENISAILLDLIMPVMDGFGLLKILNEHHLISKIPVLVISGENSIQNEQKCFDYGISDFIGKPFNAKLVRKRVQNAVDIYSYKNHLEKKVQEQTAVLQDAYQKLKVQADLLKRRHQQIIDVLATVVESRNLESGTHVQRVKGYTKIMAEAFMKKYPEYGLTEEQIDTIVQASALHDIGKITISDSILLKPGKLTKEEFEEMKKHTTQGCDILDSIKDGWDEETRKACYDICRYHHERYDGKGYPDGLVGEEIPIAAQLVSIADVYDALVNERCYKKAFPPEVAYDMIMNGECGTFSPKLIEVFKSVRAEFEELARS